jgi:hypothetical protein
MLINPLYFTTSALLREIRVNIKEIRYRGNKVASFHNYVEKGIKTPNFVEFLNETSDCVVVKFFLFFFTS